MAKANKQVIIDAIIKLIEQGTGFSSALAVIGRKWNTPQTTFARYWKAASQQHTVKQQAIKKELAEVDVQAAVDARKRAIMTADERKERLTLIARGELTKKVVDLESDEANDEPVAISVSDMLKAMAELSKMEGDYAAVKQEVTGKDGKDLYPNITLEMPEGMNIIFPSNLTGEIEDGES